MVWRNKVRRVVQLFRANLLGNTFECCGCGQAGGANRGVGLAKMRLTARFHSFLRRDARPRRVIHDTISSNRR